MALIALLYGVGASLTVILVKRDLGMVKQEVAELHEEVRQLRAEAR